MKAVIDRFYAYNHELHGSNSYADPTHGNRQAITLVSGYDADESSYRSLKAYFEQLLAYMRWDRIGDVLAVDSWNSNKLKQHQDEAYRLDKQIH
ncbi:hypothetical protein [Lactobacillus sp.]|uniref:hypothetical protein n=1 Tax=Lactobacillus sp. TaxID=1591 RepID=UPI003447BB94